LYQPFQPTLTAAGLQRLGISLEFTVASGVLRHAVHCYLQITTAKPIAYPVIPDGTQAVYIGPQNMMIGGAQSQAREIPILQAGEYFGIWFRPGALRYIFQLNLAEIANQFADSNYFPCQQFTRLADQIYQFHAFQQRALVCEHWLLRHFQERPLTPFDHALTLIYQSMGDIKIEHLANHTGWSSRHLNRQFHRHTGLSTKAFTQIIRFQHACKHLWHNPGEALSTALQSGYFDQAHLIRDYNRRLHSSPGAYHHRFMSDFSNR